MAVFFDNKNFNCIAYFCYVLLQYTLLHIFVAV